MEKQGKYFKTITKNNEYCNRFFGIYQGIFLPKNRKKPSLRFPIFLLQSVRQHY